MKAFEISGPGEFRFNHQKEMPRIAGDEVLLKVLKVGFCGSDLNTYRGKNPMVTYPRVPGHEIVAVIEETGRDVPGGYEVGDVVTVLPYTRCGTCMACREGRPNACRDNQTLGVQRDGGLTEYMAVPYDKLITDLKDLSFEAIGLVEPLAVGFHAAARGEIRPGEFTLVFGCGLVGIGVIAGSAAAGGKVIAVDIDDDKLALAKKAGAAHTVNSRTENLDEKVAALTGGDGPMVCIEAIGLAETFRKAVELASFCGRVVYVGYAKTPVEYETKLFVMKELQILGSRNADRKDFLSVLDVMRQGKIPVAALITKDVGFDQAGEALEFWDKNPAKVSKILVSVQS